MMRPIWFAIRLAFIVALGVWLAGQSGEARLVWQDYVIETSTAFLAVAALVVLLIVFTLYRVWRFVFDGPRFWRLRRKIKRMQQGQDKLTQGLAAIAAGDAVEAGKLAVGARKLLGETPATRLLQAQAAQLAGDFETAKEIYLALTDEPDFAVLGYRGIIMAALRERNWDEAERQAEKLRRLKPKTPWLCLVRFELAAHRRNWREAGAALAEASTYRLIDASLSRNHQAAILVAASEADALHGRFKQALEAAERAVKLAGDWLPATMALAEAQRAAGHDRTAWRTIERAWERNPHEQLAALVMKFGRGGKPLENYKRMERLTRRNADHPVCQLALAEAALDADLWGEARRSLLALVSRKNAARGVYLLLARLERRETGGEAAALPWLIKAAEAVPDPRWLCDSCGESHAAWQSTCSSCGAFNRLSWRTPGVGHHANNRHGRGELISGALELPA